MSEGTSGITSSALILIGVTVTIIAVVIVAWQYRRCPAGHVLVLLGKHADGQGPRIVQDGGAFVWPFLQEPVYLSLEPIPVDVDLDQAPTSDGIRVHLPTSVAVAISRDPDHLSTAVKRLLGLSTAAIGDLARTIVHGELRRIVGSMTIAELHADRDRFAQRVAESATTPLRKIGLEVVHLACGDLSDHDGYIQAIGEKAAAEAIYPARLEIEEMQRQAAVRSAEIAAATALEVEAVRLSALGEDPARVLVDVLVRASIVRAEDVTRAAQLIREKLADS